MRGNGVKMEEDTMMCTCISFFLGSLMIFICSKEVGA